MKTLKICLVILCLLHVRAVGLPQFSGALSFMGKILIKHKTLGEQTVYFDDSDYDLIMRYKWVLLKTGGNTIYCETRKKNFRTYMHRLIMNPNENEIIDHKDHNGLNNMRSNLRICSHRQNNCNTRLHITNSTGFRGVSFKKDKNAYVAQISFNNKTHYIGFYKNKYQAAEAYNRFATKLHGEFATLNVINNNQP